MSDKTEYEKFCDLRREQIEISRRNEAYENEEELLVQKGIESDKKRDEK